MAHCGRRREKDEEHHEPVDIEGRKSSKSEHT